MLIVNEAAVRAALRSFFDFRGDSDAWSPRDVAAMTRALDAAIPHLTDAGQSLMKSADCPDPAAAEETLSTGEVAAALAVELLPHFEALRNDIHRVGVLSENTGQPLAGVLAAEVGLSEEERWLRALELAAKLLSPDVSDAELLGKARWLYSVAIPAGPFGQDEEDGAPATEHSYRVGQQVLVNMATDGPLPKWEPMTVADVDKASAGHIEVDDGVGIMTVAFGRIKAMETEPDRLPEVGRSLAAKTGEVIDSSRIPGGIVDMDD